MIGNGLQDLPYILVVSLLQGITYCGTGKSSTGINLPAENPFKFQKVQVESCKIIIAPTNILYTVF